MKRIGLVLLLISVGCSEDAGGETITNGQRADLVTECSEGRNRGWDCIDVADVIVNYMNRHGCGMSEARAALSILLTAPAERIKATADEGLVRVCPP